MTTEVPLAGEFLAARFARVPGGHVLRDQVPPHILPSGEDGLAFEAFLGSKFDAGLSLIK